MQNIFDLLFYFDLTIITISCVIALVNLAFRLSLPKAKDLKQTDQDSRPLVSVLLPFRNEEDNVKACLETITNQSYKKVEIIVADDNSTDKTVVLVEEYTLLHPEVKLIKITEQPEGWKGKNYVCHILSEQAKGDYLIFIDADVRLKPDCIAFAMYEVQKHKLSLYSMFPQQLTKGLGERLVVGNLTWFLVSYLILFTIRKLNGPAFAAAVGQFLVFEKSAYLSIGGHARLKSAVLEDIDIAMAMKAAGLPCDLNIGSGLLTCRMYNSYEAALKGFAKQFLVVNKLVVTSVVILGLSIFFLPFIMALFLKSFLILIPLLYFQAALAMIALGQFNWLDLLLTPISRFQILIEAIYVIFVFRKQPNWRGKSI